MTSEHPSSPPRKKAKLADGQPATTPIRPLPRMNGKEEDVGITAFVNPDILGFSGVFKKRYTDFLVNEVLPSGEVVHLLSTEAPAVKKQNEEQPQVASEAQATSATVSQSTEGQETKPEMQAQAQTVTEPTPAGKTADENGTAQTDTPTNGNIAKSNGDGVTAWQQYSETTGNLKLTTDDEAALKAIVDEQTSSKLLALFNKVLASPNRRPRDHGSVYCPIIDDKEKRTNLHQTIRTVFRGRLDSITGDDGAVVVHAAAGQVDRGSHGGRGRGGARGRGGRDRGGFGGHHRSNRPNFEELGGDYLHFTLYKENRDTMEVIAFLARELHIKPQQFQFAGTKDRRGVTVQKVSVYRILAERLVGIAKFKGRGWKLGDFEYKPYALSLGDLTGNEFTITLRDCQRHENAAAALEGLKRGYLNYYGMQRFGTFATRTDTVGVLLLKGDFEAAVAAILKYPQHCLDAAQNPESDEAAQVGSDDKDRALAVYHFEQGDSRRALSIMPRKFSAENQLIRHLSGDRSGDYYGAIQTIQRNLRLMYVHAYQSVIWNMAATYRWTQFGDKVVEGDLIMVNEHKDEAATEAEPVEEIDADGEVVIQPTSEDRAMTDDDRFERARALTAEEASSGKYTIFDIVLPTPGYDILYPAHIVKFYEETMGKDEHGNLDPHDMRRKWRDISLSGSYRKLLARVENIGFEMREYKDEDEQFVETDADRLPKTDADKLPKSNTRQQADAEPADSIVSKEGDEMQTDEAEKPTKTAVVLKFQLGSSQYATMALRELMKGGLETYKMDFSGGR